MSTASTPCVKRRPGTWASWGVWPARTATPGRLDPSDPPSMVASGREGQHHRVRPRRARDTTRLAGCDGAYCPGKPSGDQRQMPCRVAKHGCRYICHDTRSTRPNGGGWGSSCLRAFVPTPARKACAGSHTPVPYAHSVSERHAPAQRLLLAGGGSGGLQPLPFRVNPLHASAANVPQSNAQELGDP